MKLLSNLLVLVLLIIGAIVLLPLITFGFATFCAILVFALWLLPIWIIATSDKTCGFEKVAWLLAMICLSWFAWVFYFFLAPLKPRQHYYY